MEFKHLIKDISSAPKIKLDSGYVFNAFSVGERGKNLTPELIDEVLKGLVHNIRQSKVIFDYIVTLDPGGNQWALLVANELKKPLNIIRSSPSGHKDEFKIRQDSKIHQRELYFSGFKKGDRVIIVDDIISSGDTLTITIGALKEIGVNVNSIFVIMTKGDNYIDVQQAAEVPVHTLIKVTNEGKLKTE